MAELTVADAPHGGYVRQIPDEAMLCTADLDGHEPRDLPEGVWTHLRPPRPGKDTDYPSAAACLAERCVGGACAAGEYPTAVLEHVACYRRRGAARYLRELRRILADGDGDADGRHWWLVQKDPLGRGSLLLRVRELVEDNGGEPVVHTTFVLVATAGPAVVTVADVGWECGSGHPDLVCRLGRAAVARAGALARRGP